MALHQGNGVYSEDFIFGTRVQKIMLCAASFICVTDQTCNMFLVASSALEPAMSLSMCKIPLPKCFLHYVLGGMNVAVALPLSFFDKKLPIFSATEVADYDETHDPVQRPKGFMFCIFKVDAHLTSPQGSICKAVTTENVHLSRFSLTEALPSPYTPLPEGGAVAHPRSPL